MNVFAVEGRDERAVQSVDHLVRDLVGLVLEALERLDVRRAAVGRGLEKVMQVLCCFLVAVGDLGEKVEELFVTRQETHASSRRLGCER